MAEKDITVDGNLTDVTTPTAAMRMLIVDSGVLKDVTISNLGLYIALQFGETSGDPADSTTYYIGGLFSVARGTGGARRNIQIPVTGEIEAVYGNILVAGTLGTTETSTFSVRLNDTTDTAIDATVTCDALNNQFSGTGLGVAVVPGDVIEIKWETPAWATNPTTVTVTGVVLIKVG